MSAQAMPAGRTSQTSGELIASALTSPVWERFCRSIRKVTWSSARTVLPSTLPGVAPVSTSVPVMLCTPLVIPIGGGGATGSEIMSRSEPLTPSVFSYRSLARFSWSSGFTSVTDSSGAGVATIADTTICTTVPSGTVRGVPVPNSQITYWSGAAGVVEANRPPGLASKEDS